MSGPQTEACICGEAAARAGKCFDINGDWWNGHGEARATAPSPSLEAAAREACDAQDAVDEWGYSHSDWQTNPHAGRLSIAMDDLRAALDRAASGPTPESREITAWSDEPCNRTCGHVGPHRVRAASLSSDSPARAYCERTPGCLLDPHEPGKPPCITEGPHGERRLSSDSPALTVERLTKAVWEAGGFEAESGPYEHASEADRSNVAEFAAAILASLSNDGGAG